MIQKNAVQARWRHLHYISRAERADYGYLNSVLQRSKYYEFPVDPIERKGNSGLHFIAAGCNWAPDDLPNSVYRTHKTKEEILEILKPYIDKLNDNKEMWNREAEKQLSYEDFIKTNYYD